MPRDLPSAPAPSRTAGLERLARFLPEAGARYAAGRNHDPGPGGAHAVSGLSPYLRLRLLREDEVLRAVAGRHGPARAEKFIQEVVWRTYWKGWLERRPSAWRAYQAGLAQALDRLATEAGLRRRWEDACSGTTGIDCFDAWAQELAATGTLHNHARMWFASIWVFTLRLPWELGADFFLRHLLDGDAASNTLGWRWVAGLQTQGKHYVARPDNIAKYTGGRFDPRGALAVNPAPLAGPPHPAALPPPRGDLPKPDVPAALLLTDDDLDPGPLFDLGLSPVSTAALTARHQGSPLAFAPAVTDWTEAAIADTAARWADRTGPVAILHDATALAEWARGTGAGQIVLAHAPAGATADAVAEAERLIAPDGIAVVRVLRGYDARAWPHAGKGFFAFRKHIPDLLAAL